MTTGTDAANDRGVFQTLRNAMTDGWVTGLASAATLLGLIFYAALRIGYAIFYTPLGVQPEDVGLGYADILAQSLIGLVLAAALLAYVGGSTWLLATWSRSVADDMAGHIQNLKARQESHRIRSAVGVVIGLFLVIAVLWLTGSLDALWGFGVFTVAGLLRYAYQQLGPGKQRTVRFVVTGLAVTVGLGAGFAILAARAVRDADDVKHGKATNEKFLGVPVVAWEAKVATVRWIGNNAPAGNPQLPAGCVMYLGKSDRGVILFDPRSDSSITVPKDAVVVTASSRKRCL